MEILGPKNGALATPSSSTMVVDHIFQTIPRPGALSAAAGSSQPIATTVTNISGRNKDELHKKSSLILVNGSGCGAGGNLGSTVNKQLKLTTCTGGIGRSPSAGSSSQAGGIATQSITSSGQQRSPTPSNAATTTKGGSSSRKHSRDELGPFNVESSGGSTTPNTGTACGGFSAKKMNGNFQRLYEQLSGERNFVCAVFFLVTCKGNFYNWESFAAYIVVFVAAYTSS